MIGRLVPDSTLVIDRLVTPVATISEDEARAVKCACEDDNGDDPGIEHRVITHANLDGSKPVAVPEILP